MIAMIKYLAWWAAIMPFLGAVISGFCGAVMNRRLSQYITIGGVFIAFVLSVVLFATVIINNSPALNSVLFHWLISGSYHFTIGILIDRLSVAMLVMVTFVSLLVHIYSIGYMAKDSSDYRFFCYMSAFTFAMMILVLANNYLLLFFGWEAVGLVSYLLIGYWFYKENAAFGSLKAFIVNRIGDMGFILGIAAILNYVGSLDYASVFAKAPYLVNHTLTVIPGCHWHVVTFICLLLFIGAMGKSAQMPLHVWLPESMAGPTPISALIHAATMVTAGVYMIARMSPLFEYSTTALSVMLIIGATTALFCAILGMFSFDIKRVIAYSTLSQLGYMIVGVGVSAYAVSIFHLFTHACFKALLFLAAGSVMTALHQEQDMRNMGGLAKYLPVTYVCFLIATLALVAIPPFAGFYSKDTIIAASKLSAITGAHYAYICVLLGAFVTAYYSFRAFFMTFHGKLKVKAALRQALQESPLVMVLPLVLLAIPSVLLGLLLVKWILYLPKQSLLGQAIFVLPYHNVITKISLTFHGLWSMTLTALWSLPVALSVLGIITAYYVILLRPLHGQWLKKRLWWLYYIARHQYGFDYFNDKILVRGTKALGAFLFKNVDVVAIDGVGVGGMGRVLMLLSRWFRLLHSGYVYHYALFMVFGILIFLLRRLLSG